MNEELRALLEAEKSRLRAVRKDQRVLWEELNRQETNLRDRSERLDSEVRATCNALVGIANLLGESVVDALHRDM